MDEQPGEESAENTVTPPRLQCRRCRNHFEPQLTNCPYCGAIPREAIGINSTTSAANSGVDQALLSVCIAYGIVLGTDTIWGIALSRGIATTPSQYLLASSLFDSIFLVTSLMTWRKTRFVTNLAEPLQDWRIAYGLAIPLLFAALAWNNAYHVALSELVGVSTDQDYGSQFGSHAAALFFFCLTPALLEEFFFRGIVRKTLRAHMGSHATVLVTSAMFGMAHIAVPLSVPCLFVIGIALGYLRLLSGSLWLPMAVHFLHNFFVLMSIYPEMPWMIRCI